MNGQQESGHFYVALNYTYKPGNMITIRTSKNGSQYVFAGELYTELEVDITYLQWAQEIIFGFTEGRDYALIKEDNDLFIKLDMAQHIALLQKTEKGKLIREYLISTSEQYQAGELLNVKQIQGLIDLVKVLGYFSLQEHLEKKHFDFFGKPEAWWKYRAKLLGYSKQDLLEAMQGVGKKYKNQRQALLLSGSKYELVRAATIDLFLALGKSEHYAKNLGKTTKMLAEEMKVNIYDDKDILLDFKSEDENQTIHLIKQEQHPLLLNF